MTDESISLRNEREHTIAVLGELFSRDELDVKEFERRVTLAHRATSRAELAELVADLPEHKPEAVLPLATRVAAVPSAVRPHQWMVALLGGVSRRGNWVCARKLHIVAFLGGVELDFREAQLAPGVTEIWIFAFMGGVQLFVPPGLAVETKGLGVMGGFDAIDRIPPEPDPERPMLRIRGVAIMGGVDVKTRLHGEFDREARRGEERRLPRGAPPTPQPEGT